MEYLIIGILVVILIILVVIDIIISVISMSKNINEQNINKEISDLNANVTKQIGDFKFDFSRTMNDDFTKLNDRIDDSLTKINDKVNSRLDENFEKTNKTFTSVLQSLTRIDEAQKKIDGLTTNVVSLQELLGEILLQRWLHGERGALRWRAGPSAREQLPAYEKTN